ncbi:hypothetical protein L1987_84265 [Smallanthus sonchifolius]|uniref:Uncharacterized protein n=1 Tax=Smallanthus sonchifolius TaxID=185202 RepID=A0ACB8YFC7_9ASTR|nr:hypothetical protein L1987_84265 [Smallanthus sonchifolius]
MSNKIRVDDVIMIRAKESYRYYLWDLYKRSSRSQRLEVVHEMSEFLKEITYWDSRLDMVGLILFGLEKSRFILHASHDELPKPVDLWHYLNCEHSAGELIGNVCAPVTFKSLRHTGSISNICMMAEKADIVEAVMITCGEPSVPQQQVPYGFAALGTGLPFVALSARKDIWAEDVDDDGVARLLNWAMRVLAVTAIILSYVDSLWLW